MNLSFSKKRLVGGFSLIELIVTVAVFAILSAVTIASYRNTGDGLLLNSLASRVALSIRQTQISGTATSQDFTGSFTNAYGVDFDASNNTGYLSFVDLGSPGNKLYDTGEKLQNYSFGPGYAISQICVNEKVGFPNCGISVPAVDITFIRPNPDATIKIGSNSCGGTNLCSDAEIYIRSRNGNIRKVVVWITGQISVE